MGADAEKKLGVWESILKEAATATKSSDSVLIVLGRTGIGKRTLIEKLLTHAASHSANPHAPDENDDRGNHGALDFAYFGIRDPAHNDRATDHDYMCQAGCSVLMLENPKHAELLRSRLSATNMSHCAAVVCLDLKEPWTMLEDLRKWLEILRESTSKLLLDLGMEEQDELRTRVIKVLDDYREPADGAEAEKKENSEESGGGGSVGLSYNLAIPLIVAVLRADGASALEGQKTIGWAETIETHLRNECLSYGATLVYTMVQNKTISNIDTLYEYIVHRLYAYPFKRKAVIPSRDSLFIPSGWDTREKVDQAAESLPEGGLERSFESVITPPHQQQSSAPQIEECEDMAAFLKRATSVLQKVGGATVATKTNKSSPTSGAVAADPTMTSTPSTKDGKRPTAMDLTGMGGGKRPSTLPPNVLPGGAEADNSNLANFFQNLLTRGQSGGTGAPGAAPPGASAGRGAAVSQAVRMSLAKAGGMPGIPGITPKATSAPPGETPAPAPTPTPTAAPPAPEGGTTEGAQES